jgi:hypothetical protein
MVEIRLEEFGVGRAEEKDTALLRSSCLLSGDDSIKHNYP